MMGISNRYLSEPQLVSEIANGKTDVVLEFDFNGHPRAKQLKEDLMKASPQSSYDLLKFLGAVHGTRNWLYNANVLVKNGVCKIGDIPSHREDIFMMLRNEAKIDTGIAFNMTNKISRGSRSNKLTNNECDLLDHLDLPEWFIPYIKKVYYMSSKASTIGVLRIALAFMWYKINYPDKFEM
jgi:DNA polymerase-3 subunit alpha (Gram-positive type)